LIFIHNLTNLTIVSKNNLENEVNSCTLPSSKSFSRDNKSQRLVLRVCLKWSLIPRRKKLRMMSH